MTKKTNGTSVVEAREQQTARRLMHLMGASNGLGRVTARADTLREVLDLLDLSQSLGEARARVQILQAAAVVAVRSFAEKHGEVLPKAAEEKAQ